MFPSLGPESHIVGLLSCTVAIECMNDTTRLD